MVKARKAVWAHMEPFERIGSAGPHGAGPLGRVISGTRYHGDEQKGHTFRVHPNEDVGGFKQFTWSVLWDTFLPAEKICTNCRISNVTKDGIQWWQCNGHVDLRAEAKSLQKEAAVPQFGGSSSSGGGSRSGSAPTETSSTTEPVHGDSHSVGNQCHDFWEKSGKYWIRHHIGQRQSKFTPCANSQGGSQKGGPDPAKLKPDRTIYIQWSGKGRGWRDHF